MNYWFEEYAMRGEPIPDTRPDGMSTTYHERFDHAFLRNLYWSLKNKIISREQGQIEKDKGLRQNEKLFNAREFERKCWENSARRTMAVDHAMMAYYHKRTLENADKLHKQLEWLADEVTVSVISNEHGANCPVCDAFFNLEHASRKPRFCEHCGCRLGWPT